MPDPSTRRCTCCARASDECSSFSAAVLSRSHDAVRSNPQRRFAALPTACLTSTKNLDGILSAIQTAQAPPRFTFGNPRPRVCGEKLSLRLLDDELVADARRMATIYTAIAAFENSVRDLVSSSMLGAKGEQWWNSVKADIRNRAEKHMEDEAKHKFHAQRGDAPLNYTDLKDLLRIVRANWEAFEAFLPSVDWTASVVDAVERSRNVIMHSDRLGPRDVERVGIHLRDWVTPVGT